MDFIESFLELFNINTAAVILICCGYILFKIRKMNMVLLKARIFLNKTIIHQTMKYISIAGISIALDTLIKLTVTDINGIPYSYYIFGFIHIVFLVAFTLLVYNWYLFVSDSVNRTYLG
jgi:hypothetical protein